MFKETFVFVACLAFLAIQCSAQGYFEEPNNNAPNPIQPEVTFLCKGKHEHHSCKYRQITCENLNKPINETGQCRHSCYCDEGYARNETGQCILAKDCPKDAQPSPVFNDPPVAVQFSHGHVHIHF